MNKTFVAGALEALKRFEDAVRDDEMKGAGPPGDIPNIEQELKEAREEMEDFLSQIN